MYGKILAALDGSEPSVWAGRLALGLAGPLGAEVLACHVYGADLHSRRFRDMEGGLPGRYQSPDVLRGLRDSHDSLIHEGFRSLSEGYMDSFLAEARQAGIQATPALAEGRNYVGILQVARRHGAGLIALGARGLGHVGDALLGSTAERVLRHATADVLLAAGEPAPGPVVAGIDGSEAALAAARKAAALSRLLGRPLHLAAAYDPQFHTAVFRTMAQTLSPRRRQEVGLSAQQELHDGIINDGLGTLYRGFLQDAAERCGANGAELHSSLLEGKAYRALTDYARRVEAGLVVVGRFGHHHELISQIGSQAESLARTSGPAVLVVGGAAAGAQAREERGDSAAERPARPPAEGTVQWDADALARLERVPAFARPMARRAVEGEVLAKGARRVTLAEFAAVAERFGMSRPGGGGDA